MSKLDFSKPELLQTRDGYEVRIYATDAGGDYPVHGAYLTNDGWSPESWTPNGAVLDNQKRPQDLVAKPQRVTGWVNLYKRSDGTFYLAQDIHSSQDLAKMACNGRAQGQIYIDAEVQS